MKVVAERLLIYLQRLICEERRRPQSSGPGLSEETLDSDVWVSAGRVNGLGLRSISIPGVRPHNRDG